MNRILEVMLPTEYGDFQIFAYPNDDNAEMPHLVIAHPNIDKDNPVLVRFHSECFTGDILSSKKCDCGAQLHESLRLAQSQKGMVIYLRQEGRGIGLIEKLKAYQLQAQGLDTVEANLKLGHADDERDYSIAISILEDLVVKEINLLTNNPKKIDAIKSSSIKLNKRIPLIIKPILENAEYFKTKEFKMGHLFSVK
jgi:3,4-dihydroxy 2-butanone 4-phosphate synthase / GTP cyclohydrolase II